MLTNAKSIHKIETIRKRAMRFMLNDYESSYENLLKKSENPNMNLRLGSHQCDNLHRPGIFGAKIFITLMRTSKE